MITKKVDRDIFLFGSALFLIIGLIIGTIINISSQPSMTNEQIIKDVSKCKQAGLKPEELTSELTGLTVKIQCTTNEKR